MCLLGVYWGGIGGGDSWQGAVAWTVAITADDANDGLAVAGAAIRWHAMVQGGEVVY